jgi:DNA-binding response OmpR family regulator
MATKILVVDDDPIFVRLVNKVMTAEGYEVLEANDGQEALRVMYASKPDLVLLDVVMPKMDGFQVCSRIREVSDIPVIMLTGQQTGEDDIVRGLDFGADEYLVKPVGNKEMVARVNAILRRSDMSPSDNVASASYQDDYLSVDIAQRLIKVNGESIRLTPTEFRLFSVLVANAGHILTHRQLLEKVWGWKYTDDLDYVRIYILHLRQKIEPNMSEPKYVITEPGVGYCFRKAV